jgi:hypothetical protein
MAGWDEKGIAALTNFTAFLPEKTAELDTSVLVFRNAGAVWGVASRPWTTNYAQVIAPAQAKTPREKISGR